MMSEYVYRGLFWIVLAIIAIYCGVRTYKQNIEDGNKTRNIVNISISAIFTIVFISLAVITFLYR